jgi:hypothetical protein
MAIGGVVLMLALNAEVLAGLQLNEDIIVYCQFTFHDPYPSGAAQYYYICSGGQPRLGFHGILADVSPLTITTDPLTREFVLNDIEITVLDCPWIRSIMTLNSYHMRGKPVTLKIGTTSVTSFANCAPYWSGMIDDYSWGDGFIRFQCSVLSTIPDVDMSGLWANQHPSELAKEILIRAGVPLALIGSSFTYDVDLTRSHYVVRKNDVSWDGGSSTSVFLAGDASMHSSIIYGWEFSGQPPPSVVSGYLYPHVFYNHRNNTGEQAIRVWLFASPEAFHESQYVLYGEYVIPRWTDDGLNIEDWPAPLTMDLLPPSLGPNTSSFHGAVTFDNYQSHLGGEIVDCWNIGGYGSPGYGHPCDLGLSYETYIRMACSQEGSKIKVLDAIRQLSRLCNALVIQDENGLLKWLPYHSSASSVRALTKNDIADLTPVTIEGNCISRFTVQCEHGIPNRDNDLNLVETICASISRPSSYDAFSFDGSTSRVYEEKVSLNWLNQVCVLREDITAASTTIKIGWLDSDLYRSNGAYVRNYGMCGTAGVTAGPTQDSKRKADHTASRYIYIKIDSEIIQACHSSVTAIGDALAVYDPYTGGNVFKYQYYQLELTDCVRGHMGAAAAHLVDARVHDETIIVEMAENGLGRFSMGCPILTLKTSIKNLDLQIGDFITLEHDLYLDYGRNGITAADKWEIIGKEVNPLSDNLCCELTVALVADDSDADSYLESKEIQDNRRYGFVTAMVAQAVTPFANPVTLDHHTVSKMLYGVATAFGETWIAVGVADGTDSYILRSITGGMSWAAPTSQPAVNKNLYAIAFGGGRWIAVGGPDADAKAYAITSINDGVDWTALEIDTDGVTNLYGVSYSGGTWMIVGKEDADGGVIFKSTNGTTFTKYGSAIGDTATTLFSVAGAGALSWVAVGYKFGTPNFSIIMMTADGGTTWLSAKSSASFEALKSVIYSNQGLWVAVGWASTGGTDFAHAYVSSNKTDWDDVTTLTSFSTGLETIFYSDGLYVCSGQRSASAYAVTAENPFGDWSKLADSQILITVINGIAAYGGKYVFVGLGSSGDGSILVSI